MLAMFPSEPDRYIQIHLDDLARILNTERRRLYDIVNVFEAVNMMSKVTDLVAVREIAQCTYLNSSRTYVLF